MKTTCDVCGATVSDGVASCHQCGPGNDAEPPATISDSSEQMDRSGDRDRALLAKLDVSNDHLRAISAMVGVLAFVAVLGLVLAVLAALGTIGG